MLTLAIREVVAATPRSRIVRINLDQQQFSYTAGQAVLVAAHGVEPRRPYSIAAAPEDAQRERQLELLVGIDPDGSAGPHLPLAPGALVDVEGPVGRLTFPAHPAERRFIFIAGGTGIAPLRAMLRHAMHLPHDQIGLLYSARTPGDFAYEEEMRELARQGVIELRLTVTRDASPHEWTGTRGRLGSTDLAPLVHGPETLCFVCGPQALVDEMPRLLQDLGIPRHRIRIEEW